MRCHYNEQLRLHICDLAYLDWLNGKIIRAWEDGEFLYENGELTKKMDPTFKRKKISDVYGLWDCEEGWEVDVRDKGLTRFVVTNQKELDKIQEHLEGVYWGMVDSEFKRLRYFMEEQLSAGSLELRIQHEIEKIEYGLDPKAFSRTPVLVEHLTNRKRKVFDRLPKIYADFMINGRKCYETYHDCFYTYEHYRVDAILKYRDWLSQLSSAEVQSGKMESSSNFEGLSEIPSLQLSARSAALFLRYIDHYMLDPRSDKTAEARFLAKRLCKLSSPTSGTHLRNLWGELRSTRDYQKKLVEKMVQSPKFKGLKEYIKSLESIIEHLPDRLQAQASKDLSYLKTEYESLK